jgi:hypothetical protein
MTMTLKNQAAKRVADRTHVTADEKRYITELGTHRKATKDRKTHLHKLSEIDLDRIMTRVNAQRKRASRDRALGVRPPRPLTTKADWLQAYIRVAALRDDWGAIDAKKAVAHAKKLLVKQPGPGPQHTFGLPLL